MRQKIITEEQNTIHINRQLPTYHDFQSPKLPNLSVCWLYIQKKQALSFEQGLLKIASYILLLTYHETHG